MIEVRRLPGDSGMARFASLRESTGHMIRTRGLIEVRHMTAGALSRRPGEHVVDMALRALQRDMRPGQRELSGRVVIEFRAGPVDGRVAHRAVLREARGIVIWVGGLIDVR